MKRSSDEDLSLLFGEIHNLVNGQNQFSDYNAVERIGCLNKWRDRLEGWKDAIENSLEEEGLEPSQQNVEDLEWPIRAEKMLNRIDNAIESLTKDPSERTTTEKLYGGLDETPADTDFNHSSDSGDMAARAARLYEVID